MKFTVEINGQQVEPVEAENGHAAVDIAREAHKPPEHGGDFLMRIACETTWVDEVGRPQSPGVVTEVGFRHEPAAHLREEIEKAAREKAEAEAKAAEVAELREKHRAELMAEMGITAEQVAAAKGEVSK